MKNIPLPIPFWKMNGAGNDFIIIDHRQPLIPEVQMAEFARRVCRRRFSVGADGLFLLEPSDRADFKWRFFNADGSEAEMCGNGARCVARFALQHGMAAARMCFETLAGIIEATVSGTQVTIQLTSAHGLTLDQHLLVQGQELTVDTVDTGVPHAVLFVDAIQAVDVASLGRAIRFHPQFAPAGTNVNFVSRTGQGFHIRTYERGVEGETLACGTGVVAAALIAQARGLARFPVALITSGGVALEVARIGGSETNNEQMLLSGPAQLIYRGELTEEALAV